MLASILQSTVRKVTNMCTASVVALDAHRIKINHAIHVQGKYDEDDANAFQLHLSHSFSYFRQLLLCRVALGKSFLQFSAMKMAHAPPGHHSVIGRPSSGGLHFPEYVVYRGEQVSRIHIKRLSLSETLNLH